MKHNYFSVFMVIPPQIVHIVTHRTVVVVVDVVVGVGIQNSALSKQSPAVSTIFPILTTEVDSKEGESEGDNVILTVCGGSRTRGQTVHSVICMTDLTLSRGRRLAIPQRA